MAQLIFDFSKSKPIFNLPFVVLISHPWIQRYQPFDMCCFQVFFGYLVCLPLRCLFSRFICRGKRKLPKC